MTENVEKPKLETAAGILETIGKGILIAYGIGFFIESYFDAKYGVTYLNPFRSRVAFTGIALLIQIALVILILNAETIWGIGSSYWERCVSRTFGKSRIKYRIPLVCSWLAETAALGFLVRFVFAFHLVDHRDILVQNGSPAGAPNSHPGVDILGTLHAMLPAIVVGISVFLLLTVADLMRRNKDQKTLLQDLAAVAVVVCCICFFWAEINIGDALVIDFTIFVAMIRLAFMIYKSDPHFQRTDLRLALIGICILLPTFYAERIYANVLPQWGGAAKTKLWIRFEKEIIPFGLRSPAFLLEETEEGYYLLRPNDDPGVIAGRPQDLQGSKDGTPTLPLEQVPDPGSYSAIYVPRSEVTQVLYERSTYDPK
jgi:hypothetical protein